VRGRLPHSVDSTASFIEARLTDTAHTTHSQMLYTIAFIRFVNGITDAAQKSQFAQSVASLAESVGLPGWFVDLRHAGTHDVAPSLQLLRAGCQQVLILIYSLNIGIDMVGYELLASASYSTHGH